MCLPPTKSLSRLIASALLLAAAGCSYWSDEGQVRATVETYAQAIRAEHTDAATKNCAPDMTWTYYIAPAKIWTLRGVAATAGFPESIRNIQGRDGFDIDIASVVVAGANATVQASICIPVCYDHMALRFGKFTAPTRLSLAQQNGAWVITAIQELSQRLETR